MKYLRLLSFSIGVVVILVMMPLSIMAGAMTFLSDSEIPESSWSVTFGVMSFVLLFASGFMFIGVYGHRVIHSLWLRISAAALLSIPILCTAALVFYGNHPEMASISEPLLLLSGILFSAFVWPVWLKSANPAVHTDAAR